MNHTPIRDMPSKSDRIDPFGTLSLPEVGAQWALPSDHLPIGARIGDITVASWNVLNTAYLHYIREDAQGLANSRIIKDDQRISTTDPLTVREATVLAIIEETLPKVDALLLQECSPLFIEELSNRRPDTWILITGSSANSTNDICTLVNTSRMTFNKSQSENIEKGYPHCIARVPGLQRPIMNLLFSTTSGERLRIIHTHAPGNPEHPAIEDLAEYGTQYLMNPQEPTVIVGDLNFTEEFIQEVFTKRGLPPFKNLVRMNTHIGTDGLPKQIDHILYFGPNLEVQTLPPETFGTANATTAKLINP